jgi:hypothetical protein
MVRPHQDQRVVANADALQDGDQARKMAWSSMPAKAAPAGG